jgi:ATP-binding cassette subfamily B protein
LFNAVQKAQVSWKRIKPLMVVPVIDTKLESLPIDQIQAQKVSFNYPDGPIIIHDFNLTAQSGTVVGVTGPVACGKSTLGRVFLNEYPYQGSLTINGIEVNTLTNPQLSQYLSYQGHDCELLNDTIAANIQLGEDFDVTPYLQAVCLNEEVDAMEQGSETIIGPSGSRLSGGQQARLALARILAHPKPLLILDDPFAAVDRQTEIIIWNNLQPFIQDKVVILISHRLYLFPTFTQVVWIQKGLPVVTTHEKLLKTNEAYARLYDMQVQGGDHQ